MTERLRAYVVCHSIGPIQNPSLTKWRVVRIVETESYPITQIEVHVCNMSSWETVALKFHPSVSAAWGLAILPVAIQRGR